MKDEFHLKEFKSNNKKALSFLVLPLSFLIIGIAFSYYEAFSLTYLFGQILLSLFFFQCFILLHEAGHYSFFVGKATNKIAGHLFAFLSIIPFSSWVEIHNLHHKWTGYRDKDPTTEGTVSPKFNFFTRLLVNLSWLVWFPLFTIGYRLGNYWNIKKLNKHLPKSLMPAIYLNMIVFLILYGIVFIIFGNWLVKHFLLAYFISLIISDLFILSQHSHIEIPIAGNDVVRPIKFSEQLVYTRSISFMGMVEKFLFLNFNLHELHHNYPGIPAYQLHKINKATPNKVKFLNYLIDAKSLSGMKFVFSTSKRKIGKRE